MEFVAVLYSNCHLAESESGMLTRGPARYTKIKGTSEDNWIKYVVNQEKAHENVSFIGDPMGEIPTLIPLMLGTFKSGGVPFAGWGLAKTKAFEGSCCALSLIALWSAVSSTSSTFFINDDYGKTRKYPTSHVPSLKTSNKTTDKLLKNSRNK